MMLIPALERGSRGSVSTSQSHTRNQRVVRRMINHWYATTAFPFAIPTFPPTRDALLSLLIATADPSDRASAAAPRSNTRIQRPMTMFLWQQMAGSSPRLRKRPLARSPILMFLLTKSLHLTRRKSSRRAKRQLNPAKNRMLRSLPSPLQRTVARSKPTVSKRNRKTRKHPPRNLHPRK